MSTKEDLFSTQKEYRYGFRTNVESDLLPKGLSEERVREISAKKGEPHFLLEFRLKAFAWWKKMSEPHWANLKMGPLDFQEMHYYSAPKVPQQLSRLEEVDPELLRTFDKLGIPLEEQKQLANVAVDVVFDSVSLGVTLKEKLAKAGVIFCSLSEAADLYPELVQKYLGSVVPIGDNFYATLNSAVFSDGSFVYLPKGVRCPLEISTYFRINERKIGQFERTLIIAEEDSYVSYLEGCTAPAYDTNQLHAAVVELVANKRAEIKYSTVQNWYAGDRKSGEGGVYNFVTKRGKCTGEYSKISWTQVEAGAAITWKYPSCILEGKGSIGEFYSVALTNGKMQADTGTKMIHLGERSRSTIISKGISADQSHNSFRSLVHVTNRAKGARNFTQCDSMLIGNACSANTFPCIEVRQPSAEVEHEASTSKMNEEQLFYLQTRGLNREDGIYLVVCGFCKDVFTELPLEFSTESQKLLTFKLEGSIG